MKKKILSLSALAAAALIPNFASAQFAVWKDDAVIHYQEVGYPAQINIDSEAENFVSFGDNAYAPDSINFWNIGHTPVLGADFSVESMTPNVPTYGNVTVNVVSSIASSVPTAEGVSLSLGENATLVGEDGKASVVLPGYGSFSLTLTYESYGWPFEAEFTVNCEYEPAIPTEYVDLGLPSGTLWAPFNLGAEEANDFGDLVAWGETEPKSYYYYDSYKYWDQDNKLWLKYSDEGKRTLDSDDDAATVNWGEDWRMPLLKEWVELEEKCEWTWQEADEANGVSAGYVVSSKANSNSIFLPAAGRRTDSDRLLDGNSYGTYWAADLYPGYDESGAVCSFNSSSYGKHEHARWKGLSIRPVLAHVKPIAGTNFTCSLVNGVLTVESEVFSSGIIKVDGTDYELVDGKFSSYLADEDKSLVLTVSYGDIALSSDTVSLVNTVAVDLGLSVMWASFNVGATAPEDYGAYFSWGETEPKENYAWSTYKWMNEAGNSWQQINKYTLDDNITSGCWYDAEGNFIGDGKATLDPEDDAASANWASGWRMPTLAEWQELQDSCDWAWETVNGVAGYTVTSKSNGNSIFLPAAGRRDGTTLQQNSTNGYYLSSGLRTVTKPFTHDAFTLQFRAGGYYAALNWNYRYRGYSVRAVLDVASVE